MGAVTCSPGIFLHSTSNIWRASLLLHIQHQRHSSTMPFHFPLKRNKESWRASVIDIEDRTSGVLSRIGTNWLYRAVPFSCHLTAQEHRTGWCFKAASSLSALTHARSRPSRPSSPHRWPGWSSYMLYLSGTLFLLLIAPSSCLVQNKHLFHGTFWTGSS